MLAISDWTGRPFARSEVVICLDAGHDAAALVDTLAGVLTTAGSARMVAISGRPDVLAAVELRLAPLNGPDVWTAPDSEPGDGIETVASAVAPADLVLLGAGCRLTQGWLEALSAAARSDLIIATASALDADLVDGRSEPGLLNPGPVPPGSLPRIEAPVGPCVYVRRGALELTGLVPGPAFARRCRERGLAHVLAGAVIVAGPAPAGIDRGGAERPSEAGTRARLRARASRAELAVVIDARELDGPANGTRVHLCELIRAVAEAGGADVTALLPAQMDPDTRRLLDRVEGVRKVAVDAAGQPPVNLRGDVVHRPHQVHSAGDLTLLARLAPRFVLTQQDLIEFHTPLYFSSETLWHGYREMTRLALGSSDRVLFFSEHARAEALALELVEPVRAEVIALGTDHALAEGAAGALAPSGAAGLDPASEVVLCLGTDMIHKNREFALTLAAQLRRAHGWHGTLVFAGAHVGLGSSQAAERAVLAADPDLAAGVLELGEVTDAERRWLLERAALVLYPTVHEGFGLVPYEAAAHGVPCLWAPGTALAEMLGDSADGLIAWDPVAGAERALSLMRDAAARAAQVQAVLTAGRELSWARTGRGLLDAYRAAAEGPPAPTGVIMRTSSLMSGAVSPDGISLVGPNGLLPADAERPLLAVLSRPRLANPMLRALRYGYGLARHLAGD